MLLTLPRYSSQGEHHVGLSFAGRLSQRLEAQGTPCHQLGEVRLSRPWSIAASRRSLRTLLLRIHYDAVVVHAYWPHLVWSPELRKLGAPWTYFQHDLSRGNYWLESLARMQAPPAFIANSYATERSVNANLFKGTPGEVVYYPVEALAPSSVERQDLRKPLGVAPGQILLVQASRFERWKGHGVLIEALALLRNAPDWACWIAGSPQRRREQKYLRNLQSRVQRLRLGDRVKFVGHTDAVGTLLKAADALVQLNTAPEPFGIVLVEAMYAGLPIVSAALGGALEVVDDSCGLLVPPTPTKAADALKSLLSDAPLRARLGSNGPQRARELCEPARQARRFEEAVMRSIAQP
jgi:glycosyltransferase involved in cell wall biosynthesis